MKTTKKAIKGNNLDKFPPFMVKSGQTLSFGSNPAGNCAGWKWCLTESGTQGWIPEAFICKRGDSYVATMNSSWPNLVVEAGEEVTVLLEHLDRAFCRSSSGEEGWIHCSSLE